MVYKNLLLKSEDLSYVMSKVSSAVSKDPNALNDGLNEINNCIQDLIAFAVSHKGSLSDCDKECVGVINSWNAFVSVLKKYQKIPRLSREHQCDLGNKLQAVNVANSKLVDRLRDLV